MCLCGDTQCPSCGPAQGNWRCPICNEWADNCCEHISEETGDLLPEYVEEAEEMARQEAEAEQRYWAAVDAAEARLEEDRKLAKDYVEGDEWPGFYRDGFCSLCRRVHALGESEHLI